MVEIHTEHLTIRETDTESVKFISDKNKAISNGNFLSLLSDDSLQIILEKKDAITALVAKLQAYVGEGESIVYGAWLNDKLIGYLGLKNHTTSTPEIQIELDPDYHGQGYGYELLSTLLMHFFSQGYTQLRYVVLPSNKASIALVEKVGGICQEAESDVERLLIKTYLIPAPENNK